MRLLKHGLFVVVGLSLLALGGRGAYWVVKLDLPRLWVQPAAEAESSVPIAISQRQLPSADQTFKINVRLHNTDVVAQLLAKYAWVDPTDLEPLVVIGRSDNEVLLYMTHHTAEDGQKVDQVTEIAFTNLPYFYYQRPSPQHLAAAVP